MYSVLCQLMTFVEIISLMLPLVSVYIMPVVISLPLGVCGQTVFATRPDPLADPGGNPAMPPIPAMALHPLRQSGHEP